MNLRERRRRETERAIHLALVDLVARKDFNDITADDIAQAAGVSLRTFFNYFPNKEAALFGPAADVSDAFVSCLTCRRGLAPEDLYRLHRGLISALEPLRDLLLLIRELEQTSPRVAQAKAAHRAELLRRLTEGLRMGEVGKHPMTHMIFAEMMFAAGFAALDAWLYDGKPLSETIDLSWQSLKEAAAIFSGGPEEPQPRIG